MLQQPLLPVSGLGANPQNGNGSKCFALVVHESTTEDYTSLSVQRGDIVTVLRRNGAWATVSKGGQDGDVPLECLDMEYPYCFDCERILEPGSHFCRICGARRIDNETNDFSPAAKPGVQVHRLREEVKQLRQENSELRSRSAHESTDHPSARGSREIKMDYYRLEVEKNRNLSVESQTQGTRSLTDMGQRRWAEAGLKPSLAQILEYCFINMRAWRSGFPNQSLIFLPCKVAQKGLPGQELPEQERLEQERWFPVRVIRPPSMLTPLENLFRGGDVAEVDASEMSLRRKIYLHVDTTNEAVQYEFKQRYRGRKEDYEQIYPGEQGHLPIGDMIRNETQLQASKACMALWIEQTGQIEADRDQQEGRLLLSLQRILGELGGGSEFSQTIASEIMCWKEKMSDAQIRMFTAHDSVHTVEDCIEDVKSVFGKKPECRPEGPGYEEAYLCWHSVMYFAFLALFFCFMLAFSSYLWMQFFFLLLYRGRHPSEPYANSGQMSFYFFGLPLLLMGLAVCGFQVSILIRCTLKSPQMSRQRALGVGLCVKFLDLLPSYHSIAKNREGSKVNSLQERDWFFTILREAMRMVDTWFTIGLEVSICFGFFCNLLFSHLTNRAAGKSNFELSDWVRPAVSAMLITGAMLLYLDYSSKRYATKQEAPWIERLEGRMLHWKSKSIFAMSVVLYIIVLGALINKQLVYEAMILGGVMWVMLTIIFAFVSEMVLTQNQRGLMTLVERCLNDRNIPPGRMVVRFYEIRNKLEQQMVLEGLSTSAFFNDAPADSLEHDLDLSEQGFQQLKTLPGHICRSVTIRNLSLMVLLWGTSYFITKQHNLSPSNVTWFTEIILFIFFLLERGKGRWIALPVLVLMLYFNMVIRYRGNKVVDSFDIQTYFQWGEDKRTVFSGVLTTASPFMVLIPVMVLGHKILVRRMPILNQGSHKETGNPHVWYFNIYHGFMIFYSVGSVIFILIGLLSFEGFVTKDGVDQWEMFTKGDLIHNKVGKDDVTYPVCNMRWGAPGQALSVVDMVLLARYAYSDNSTTFSHAIDRSFHESGLPVVYEWASEPTALPRMSIVKFKSEDQETIVVAIRGTSSPDEVFCDLSLYAGVGFLGFTSMFFDVFDLVPNALIGRLLDVLRLPLVQSLEYKIFEKVVDKVEELKRAHPDAYFVLTGHSLGGGIAGAVGGITNTPTIAFSAPGNHFNRFMLASSLERSWRNMVNIWPERDIVGHADRHDSMVQRIVCRNPHSGKVLTTASSPLTCHFMSTTICELWRVCGDPRGRKMTVCTDVEKDEPRYDESTWGMYINRVDGARKPDISPKFHYHNSEEPTEKPTETRTEEATGELSEEPKELPERLPAVPTEEWKLLF